MNTAKVAVLQCTVRPTQQRVFQPMMSRMPKLRTSGLYERYAVSLDFYRFHFFFFFFNYGLRHSNVRIKAQ